MEATSASDDWRATTNLTINFGLRWDSQTGISERHGKDWTRYNPTYVQTAVTSPSQANYAVLVGSSSTTPASSCSRPIARTRPASSPPAQSSTPASTGLPALSPTRDTSKSSHASAWHTASIPKPFWAADSAVSCKQTFVGVLDGIRTRVTAVKAGFRGSCTVRLILASYTKCLYLRAQMTFVPVRGFASAFLHLPRSYSPQRHRSKR